jgi:hypothetical protein
MTKSEFVSPELTAATTKLNCILCEHLRPDENPPCARAISEANIIFWATVNRCPKEAADAWAMNHRPINLSEMTE